MSMDRISSCLVYQAPFLLFSSPPLDNISKFDGIIIPIGSHPVEAAILYLYGEYKDAEWSSDGVEISIATPFREWLSNSNTYLKE